MNREQPGPPFPSPLLALGVSLAAMLLYMAIATAAEGNAFGVALASALAFGGIGTLVARFVPEPAPVRIGLTPFPVRAALPVLLLVPAVLLSSELDNWIRLALDAKSPEGLGKAIVPAAEIALLMIFLQPTVEEFFFRGVLLQGCVSGLGRLRGVLLLALLQALLFARGDLATPAGAASAIAQTFALAVLLGFVRLATGSVLPAIALSCTMQAAGLVGLAYPNQLAIPGFNAPGATTPVVFLLPATASVALGVWLLSQQLAREPALPPIPPRSAEDDEESGPLF